MTFRLLVLIVVHALDLYLLVLSTTDFWTLLGVEGARDLHLRIPVIWLLIRVPDLLIVILLRLLLSLISGNVDAVVTTDCNISVGILEAMSLSFLTVNHGLSISVSNSCFSRHHLLVFCQELLVTRVATNMLQTVRVGATVAMNLLWIMFSRNGNHGAILVSLVLLLPVLGTTDKDYVAL